MNNKAYAQYDERRWNNWLEKLETDPNFARRYLFLRSLVQGMKMEKAIQKKEKGSRFLLGSYAATLGITTQQSLLGVMGPALRTIQQRMTQLSLKLLPPEEEGDRELFDGITAITLWIATYLSTSALKFRRKEAPMIDTPTREEIEQTLRLLGTIILASSECFPAFYREMADTMKKKEKHKKSYVAASVATILTLLLATIALNKGDFEGGFTALKPYLLQVLTLIEEPITELAAEEEPTNQQAKEWMGHYQTLKIALEKGEENVFEKKIDEIVQQCGADPIQFRKDLEDLCRTNEQIEQSLVLAFSAQESVQTGISQTI